MSEVEHPELDDSLLLSPANHSKYHSYIGCATWLVTLGRFKIAHAVNTYARFSQAPREGHMIGLKRVFGYLKKWIKETTLIDPNYLDHSQFPTEAYDQWKEFYPDAEEPMPAKDMLPKPLGKKIWITAYTDSDHAHDVVTRRSVTGELLFLNNTPVKDISQRQKTVEPSTYGSELVATRVTTALILEYRNTSRIMGVELDGPALLLGDNNSVVLNCTNPDSVLKKKHVACNYH